MPRARSGRGRRFSDGNENQSAATCASRSLPITATIGGKWPVVTVPDHDFSAITTPAPWSRQATRCGAAPPAGTGAAHGRAVHRDHDPRSRPPPAREPRRRPRPGRSARGRRIHPGQDPPDRRQIRHRARQAKPGPQPRRSICRPPGDRLVRAGPGQHRAHREGSKGLAGSGSRAGPPGRAPARALPAGPQAQCPGSGTRVPASRASRPPASTAGRNDRAGTAPGKDHEAGEPHDHPCRARPTSPRDSRRAGQNQAAQDIINGLRKGRAQSRVPPISRGFPRSMLVRSRGQNRRFGAGI